MFVSRTIRTRGARLLVNQIKDVRLIVPGVAALGLMKSEVQYAPSHASSTNRDRSLF